MPFFTSLGLALGYALVASLLLALCIRGRWPAWLKILSIVIVSCYYLVHYNSLQQALGWPTEEAPPSRFLLIAQQITEPDNSRDQDGSIYLWAVAINDGEVEETPRSYLLPYSKSLHSELDQARVGQRKGIPQVGEVPEPDSRFFATKLTASQVDKIQVYDLPEPTLPDK